MAASTAFVPWFGYGHLIHPRPSFPHNINFATCGLIFDTHKIFIHKSSGHEAAVPQQETMLVMYLYLPGSASSCPLPFRLIQPPSVPRHASSYRDLCCCRCVGHPSLLDSCLEC